MAVKGKRVDEWTHQILCDFGDSKRRQQLTTSFSVETAIRRWKRLKPYYGKNYENKEPQRLWVEERYSRKVVADTVLSKTVTLDRKALGTFIACYNSMLSVVKYSDDGTRGLEARKREKFIKDCEEVQAELIKELGF